MIALLIIIGIIVYFLLGYVSGKLIEEFELVDLEDDDGFLLTLIMIFFPVVVIGIGIKWAGNKLSEYFINLFRK